MNQMDTPDAETRITEATKLHDEVGFAAMRRAGKLAAETLDFITPHVRPDVTTNELDELCHKFTIDHDAVPAPLGYRGFPKSVCTSVNHAVCHGIPGDKVLTAGDIINIDVTPVLDGWHGDTSRTFYVGKVGVKARRLVETTYEAMMRGIEVAKPGATLGDIGHAIQSYVEEKGFSIVREYCGHGIGRNFHEEPQLLHYGIVGTGRRLQAGMVFTIEPMVNEGSAENRVLDDDWTAVTADGKLSAQYEHTILVSRDGPDVLSRFEDLPW